ncbi:MAG: cardiolipin synthase [Marinilabiliaceae bacterium]|nr:cardiolipin synthase [Marinilabiliaceae bacterium]
MDLLHYIYEIIKISVIIIYFAGIIYLVVDTVLENRSPVKTISWILVLVLLPVVGFIFFIFVGQNFRKEKIIARNVLKNQDIFTTLATQQVDSLKKEELFHNNLFEEKRQLLTLLLNNSNAVITTGNSVKLLHNGQVTFEAIIFALKNAKSFIHLEYYIFSDDKIGRTILNILKQKAKEGIEVRLIVDDVGSWELKEPFYKELRNSGIDIYSFLPVHFPKLTSKINYRNHRKIIVIDGTVGFMGGVNIADRYIEGNKEYGIWRDTHLLIEGDAINSLQTIFLTDWYFVSHEELSDKKYFPYKKANGDKIMQIVSSGPDSDWHAIMMGIFHAIVSAKKYVYVATPYFMPTEAVLLALITAALGGVDVKVIIPEKSDAFISLRSSRSYIHELLDANIKTYFYRKGFIHSKVLIIDDFVSVIGSANMDFRSFEQNFEISAFIYDEKTAKELTITFEEDLSNSIQITQNEWNNRSRIDKWKESFARLVGPLL